MFASRKSDTSKALSAVDQFTKTLLPYQRDWVFEPSRCAIANKGRQIGFSHATAFGCIIGAHARNIPQIILSASQSLSDEVLDKARIHCRVLASMGWIGVDRFEKDSASEISWGDNRRIIALPASPRTARSFSGDIWLDEFAYHLDPEGIQEAVFPIATRGNRRIRVFSTPNGAQGLFYRLYTKPPKNWVVHTVPMATAINQGLEIDLDAAHEAAGNDARLIGQWYNCEFTDGDQQYYPTRWLERCQEWDAAPDDVGVRYFAGLDIGRKKDATVLVVIGVVDGVAWVVHIETMKRTEFERQRVRIMELFGLYGWSKIAIDANGIGSQLTEELSKLMGINVVIPCDFQAKTKELVFTGAFKWLSNNLVRLPRTQAGAALIAEGKSVRRVITPSENVSYRMPRDATGHCDGFVGLALGLYAAGQPVPARGIGQMPVFAIA